MKKSHESTLHSAYSEELHRRFHFAELLVLSHVQSCLTSEGLILTQFSTDTDLDIPSFPCLARAMPFRISDTSCIANVSATSCYVVAMKSDEPVYSLQLSAISSWLLSVCGMLEILFKLLFPLYYTCNHLVSKTHSDFWAALHIFPNIDVLCLAVFARFIASLARAVNPCHHSSSSRPSPGRWEQMQVTFRLYLTSISASLLSVINHNT